MDPATLSSSTFTLTNAGGTVPATVTYDEASATATLTPTNMLAPSNAYTATLTTAVRAAERHCVRRQVVELHDDRRANDHLFTCRATEQHTSTGRDRSR
jgi:hypothetical protein